MAGSSAPLQLWHAFLAACKVFNKSKPALPGVLLSGLLVHLMKEVLSVPRGPPANMPTADLVLSLVAACHSTYAHATRPYCHPGLQRWLPSSSSLSPAQLAVCGANLQAALQQQVRLVSVSSIIWV
jgi:hypothetical protein